MSVYCYRCGQRLASGSRHCPSCGAAIFYDENGLRDPASASGAGAESEEREGLYGQDASQTQGTSTGQAYTYGQGSPYGRNEAYGQNYAYGQTNAYGRDAWQQNRSGADGKAESCAKASMILGVISGIMCIILPFVGLALSIAALILGIMGMKAEVGRRKAIAGLVMGIIFLLLNGLVVGLALYYLANPELLDRMMQQLNLSGFR